MTEARGKVLLLGAEGIGQGDDTLGYGLVARLLEALSKRDDAPSAIALWNTAVKLVTDDSPLLPYWQRLEAKGVNILSCQTCVKQLGLTGKMGVGKLATLDEILDLILHNDLISL